MASERIEAPIRLAQDGMLLCPFCDGMNIHHANRFSSEPGSLSLGFWGECGHEFNIRITFHKGVMYTTCIRDVDAERENVQRRRENGLRGAAIFSVIKGGRDGT